MQAAKFSIAVQCNAGIAAPSFLWKHRVWSDFITLQQPKCRGPVLEIGLLDQPAGSLDPVPEPEPHIFVEEDSVLFLYAGAVQRQRLLATQKTLYSGSSALQSLFMFAISHALAILGGLALHGAAFKHTKFSPLILGDSRSGKSTLTTLALRMGAKVVSDDHLLLSNQETGGRSVFEVQAMRSNLHLRSPTHHLLPEALASQLRPASFNGEQRWILPQHLNPQFERRISPTVILCSMVDRNLEKTDVQPMQPPEALAELMRCSSPLFLSAKFPQERAILTKLMLAVISSLPAFRLQLGRDLLEKPEQTFQRIATSVS